ncbi:hypothetical protein BJ138DRAFT_1140602 [Hygrophoropsis aurantiaca]|uniref:Uncharacterized protein n=1 Tax=Hygrophoropsis aurantiaca TaxID=72124 RepID=A0ACB8AT02_9AGAM|nr:hypothetical protein BJ138DRAFT_1140602 [Hygrophoropsis aurantiaca]
MNVRTLQATYFARGIPAPLTATQLISLHLYLYRPRGEENSSDPLFGPYISALPRNFDGHPLTWLVEPAISIEENSLLETLPPSVYDALQQLHTRFLEDWTAVSEFMRTNSTTIEQLSIHANRDSQISLVDFVWAWLTVNTRCIYYRLKASKSDPDNLTMCPILDFANHTTVLPHITPVPTNADLWDAAPIKRLGDDFSFISPGDATIKAGEELYLTYGSHSNRTLFVEYGFVNQNFEDAVSKMNCEEAEGEVHVQDIVEQLISPDTPFGSIIKNVLCDEGYWGDWTLHALPKPAHPSYRLITALRLYHHAIAHHSVQEDILKPWRDVIMGLRENISGINEAQWRQSLVNICDTLIARAEPHIRVRSEREDKLWYSRISSNIETLWIEENAVAMTVKTSILRGEEF